jgi:hypothetical protein
MAWRDRHGGPLRRLWPAQEAGSSPMRARSAVLSRLPGRRTISIRRTPPRGNRAGADLGGTEPHLDHLESRGATPGRGRGSVSPRRSHAGWPRRPLPFGLAAADRDPQPVRCLRQPPAAPPTRSGRTHRRSVTGSHAPCPGHGRIGSWPSRNTRGQAACQAIHQVIRQAAYQATAGG